jgi:hypothetical protein
MDLGEDTRSKERYLSPGPHEYDGEVQTTWPRRSVSCMSLTGNIQQNIRTRNKRLQRGGRVINFLKPHVNYMYQPFLQPVTLRYIVMGLLLFSV